METPHLEAAGTAAGLEGRHRSRPLPGWIRAGDSAAEALVWALLAGGFFTQGYVDSPLARGLAWLGSGLLGIWAVVGFWNGRWRGEAMQSARWALAVMAFLILWSGLQILPLPSAWTAAISPAWSEIERSFRASGLEFPRWAPLAQNPGAAFGSWNQLVAAGLFFSGALLLASRRSCSLRLLMAVALVSMVEAWWGLWEYSTGGARSQGAIYNPNHHAALVVMGVPAFFARLIQWRRFSPSLQDVPVISGSNPLILLLGCGIVTLIGWLTSFSRGSLIFGGGTLLMWISLELLGRWRERSGEEDFAPSRSIFLMAAVGFIALVCAATALFLSASILEGYVARGWSDELQGRGRMDLWRATLEGLSRSPWIGFGLGGTAETLNRYSTLPMGTVAIWSHNDFLQLVAELGIPASCAALALVAIFMSCLTRDWIGGVRRLGWSPGLMQRAALAGVLIALSHAITDFHLRIPLIGFTFLILLALATAPGSLMISPRLYSRLFHLSGFSRPWRRSRSGNG